MTGKDRCPDTDLRGNTHTHTCTVRHSFLPPSPVLSWLSFLKSSSLSALSLSIHQSPIPPSLPASRSPFPPAPLSILILRCKGTACHIQHAQKKKKTFPLRTSTARIRAKEIGAHLAGRECPWPCLKSSHIPVFHPNRSRQDGGHQCWLDASLPHGVPLGSILGPLLIFSILSNLVCERISMKYSVLRHRALLDSVWKSERRYGELFWKEVELVSREHRRVFVFKRKKRSRWRNQRLLVLSRNRFRKRNNKWIKRMNENQAVVV